MLTYKHLLAFVMLLATFNIAASAPMCYQLFLNTSKDVKIEMKSSSEESQASELNIRPKSFEAAAKTKEFNNQIAEIVSMMAVAREPVVSDKEINIKGKLKLGLRIGNGFTLELKYRHQFHETEGAMYILEHINMFSPTGKQLDISSSPIHAYDVRKLSLDRTNFEIGTYPDGFRIQAKIPTMIKGDVMREIQELSPKLELVPKEILSEIAKESNFKELQKKANRAYMKFFIKRYFFRGLFKSAYKLFFYEPLKLTLSAGIIYVAVHQMGALNQSGKISEFFLPKHNIEWVKDSVKDSANAKALPINVKTQLLDLASDLETQKITIEPNANGKAMDQNSTRLQVSKDQYLWTTTVTDRETGREVTLIFLSRDNKQGHVEYVALQVDPIKYKELIGHIRSIGQLIPLTSEDLKP